MAGTSEQEQHHGIVAALRRAQLDLDELYLRYFALGGTAGLVELGEASAPAQQPVLVLDHHVRDLTIGGERIGIEDENAAWSEVVVHAGKRVGNLGGVQAEAQPWHGQPYSATLTVPPLATVWLLNEG